MARIPIDLAVGARQRVAGRRGRHMKKHGAVLCPLLLLGACASTPDVVIQYYPAKSVTTFTTTQNLACTQDQMTLVVTNTVSASTEYSADTSKPPHSVRIKDLDNEFADASLSVELFGDGRLKSINASSTGEGQAVISAAAGLAGMMAPMVGSSPGAGPRKLPVCAVLKNWSDGKAALSFVKSLDVAQLPQASPVPLNDENAAVNDPGLYGRISGYLPRVMLLLSEKTSVPRAATYNARDPHNTISLTLRDTSRIVATFLSEDQTGQHLLGSKSFIVPGPGDYVLPIPKAALFGGETFSIALSESGAVASISYGKTSGAAAAVGATQSAVSVITPPAPTQ
jgi:hypothetical protein